MEWGYPYEYSDAARSYPDSVEWVNTDGEMKTGVLPRNCENGSSGSCTPSNSNPSNSVSNDSGGGASAWGSGGKKGRSGFAASLRKDHKQSSVDMVHYMYVTRCRLRVGRGERRRRRGR